MDTKKIQQGGFSIVEMLVSMTIILILMGIASTLFARAMGVRSRESRTTDALTSSYAALNVLSREISNSGYGLINPSTGQSSNGIVIADSSDHQIHVRSNFTNVAAYTDVNAPGITSDPGEDVTYYFEPTTKSIVRFDPNASPTTSVVVNKISNVTFSYFDYAASGSSVTGPNAVPTEATGRIVITVTVNLEPVYGQPNPQAISFTSEVNMRNSNYMLQQY